MSLSVIGFHSLSISTGKCVANREWSAIMALTLPSNSPQPRPVKTTDCFAVEGFLVSLQQHKLSAYSQWL